MSTRRQHFNQFGKPKRQYFSAKQARERRDEFYRMNGWQMQVYKCAVCQTFHVGNKEYWRLRRQWKKHDDVLVGKLVHALRLVLDKTT